MSLESWLLDAHKTGNLIDTGENHLPVDIYAIGKKKSIRIDGQCGLSIALLIQ